MRCKNCGAELNGNHVCEYCGTKYNYISDNGDGSFFLEYNGNLYKVYLTSIRNETVMDQARDVNGVLHRTTRKIQIFEFITA